MSSIRLVANLIPGTYNLRDDIDGLGHFQLVFVGDDGSLKELEVQMPRTFQFSGKIGCSRL